MVPLILLVLTTLSLINADPPQFEIGTELIDEDESGPAPLVSLPLVATEELYNMKRTIGRSVTMRCSIHGEAPLNIFIIQDHIATARNKNKKRRIEFETIHDLTNPTVLTAVYTIDSLKKKDGGIYRCQGEAGNGEVIISTAELFAIDPCKDVVCGYKEQCINVQGTSKCTCDYMCEEEGVEKVCVEGITYSSVCHFQRVECRTGGTVGGDVVEGQCADFKEATEASCAFLGNGHVEMFDANYFSFSGSCSYKMIEDNREGMFIVYARTEICGDKNDGVCLRSVTIYIDRQYGLSIERGWLINDNGRSRNIQNGESLTLGGGLLNIKRIGKTMVGDVLGKGIKFYYDGLNYLRVTVPLSFVNMASDFTGFCGGIPVDYIPVPSMGRDVGISGDVVGMKGLSSKCTSHIKTYFSNCLDASEIAFSFTESPIVAACKDVVPISQYLEAAVYDTCTCDKSTELNYCYCNVMYAYKEDCRQAGVEVDYDSTQCEKNFHQQAFKAEQLTYRRARKWYQRLL